MIDLCTQLRGCSVPAVTFGTSRSDTAACHKIYTFEDRLLLKRNTIRIYYQRQAVSLLVVYSRGRIEETTPDSQQPR